MGLGMIMTAMPAVNAIPAVVAAPPGIVTYAALPVVTARGYVDGGTDMKRLVKWSRDPTEMDFRAAWHQGEGGQEDRR
jgi:hypothetical protein